ncbi:hypothetical protein [Winogradskyella sp.]|uniref:hypothetical protein n=1 Tax=Winogradskyella sp. TaxID=1883156 RepID=UPI003BA9143B
MLKKLYVILCFSLFASCEELIEVEDISNEAVIILAPVDNTTLTNNSVGFSWSPLDFAESYQLQVASPNFENAQVIVEDTIVNTTSFTKTLEAGTYQWRIKAINFAYETPFTTQNLNIEN